MHKLSPVLTSELKLQSCPIRNEIVPDWTLDYIINYPVELNKKCCFTTFNRKTSEGRKCPCGPSGIPAGTLSGLLVLLWQAIVYLLSSTG